MDSGKISKRDYIKIIALITMLLDHTGFIYKDIPNYNPVLYEVLRYIGRISFPLFCICLTEGFCYTSDRFRYAVRLFVFAIISEVPFDMCMNKHYFSIKSQNVMFTFFLSLCMLVCIEKVNESNLKIIYEIITVSLFSLLTYLIKTDYYIYGIVIIFILYKLRLYFPFSFIMIKEEKARDNKKFIIKYFYYIFYPVHLLVLSFFR
jgi:hypothetical protein